MADHILHLFGGGNDLLQRFARALCAQHAQGNFFSAGCHGSGSHVCLLLNGLDHCFNFLGRLCSALCQLAHFCCDDGKAAAMFTGARSFNRRVQRQQVGLRGNVFNHAGDVANLARTLVEVGELLARFLRILRNGTNNVDGLLNNQSAIAGHFTRLQRALCGAVGAVTNFANRSCHLLHGGRHLRGLMLLRLGSCGRLLCNRRHTFRAFQYLSRAMHYAGQRF